MTSKTSARDPLAILIGPHPNLNMVCRISCGEQSLGRVSGGVFDLCGEDQVAVDKGGAQVVVAPLPHLRTQHWQRHHVQSG